MRNAISKCGCAFVPVDFHYHGLDTYGLEGRFESALSKVEFTLQAEKAFAIATVFVQSIEILEELCAAYSTMCDRGDLQRLLGVAVEGPLVSAIGGTPRDCYWRPTIDEWKRIAALGNFGLRYSVISPDVNLGGFGPDFPTDIEWIIQTLHSGNVLPALGHFASNNPKRSAECIQRTLSVSESLGKGPVITDHMFNDMPHVFKHAWRTSGERAFRDSDLATMDTWDPQNLEKTLGPIPSVLIDAAFKGLLKICLNFDGEHVDLEICRRSVELIGSSNLIMMTDQITDTTFAGQPLSRRNDNSLLYQSDGIVAGGTCSVWEQVANMRKIGLSNEQIYDICHATAMSVLGNMGGDSFQARQIKSQL